MNKNEDYKYYITKNTFVNDKQGLKSGVRIEKIPASWLFDLSEGEGPFDDLNTLKRKSTIYRNLYLRNQKRSQQICLEKNIAVVKDFILTKSDLTVDTNFINVLEHCISGKINKGKVVGVHYYDKERVKITDILKHCKITGVIKAEIKFLDITTNSWVKKDQATTFFPLNWNMTTLFHECLYAVENMIQKEGSKNVYISKTKSGIKVEIISVNKKMKSIYPLL